jgi:hypothetical protein
MLRESQERPQENTSKFDKGILLFQREERRTHARVAIVDDSTIRYVYMYALDYGCSVSQLILIKRINVMDDTAELRQR